MNRIVTTTIDRGRVRRRLRRDVPDATRARRHREHHGAGHSHPAISPATRSGRPMPAACTPRCSSSADGATISIQDGNVGKHMHPNTNEIQYILEGTGTIWLGDKEVKVEAGRPRHHPEGHRAWRHQAGRPPAQGDRDQDPAAGAG